MKFEEAFQKLLKIEGGYSDNPNDPGGKTKFGITEKVARAHGYKGDMKDFPISLAKQIYKTDYWDLIKGDNLPDTVQYDIFDTAVNSGVKTAIILLQRALKVKEDGIIGPITLKAAQSATPLLNAHFEAHRLLYMTDLKNWNDAGRGWAKRIANCILEEK